MLVLVLVVSQGSRCGHSVGLVWSQCGTTSWCSQPPYQDNETISATSCTHALKTQSKRDFLMNPNVCVIVR